MAWGIAAFAMAVLFFCFGILANHRDMQAAKPFAFYLIGIAFMAIASALIVLDAFNWK